MTYSDLSSLLLQHTAGDTVTLSLLDGTGAMQSAARDDSRRAAAVTPALRTGARSTVQPVLKTQTADSSARA